MNNLFNFNTVGTKIKNVAKWLCWINIYLIWVASIILAIFFIGNYQAEMIWIPLICAIFLPFVVWFCYLLIYAFGELVSTNIEINEQLKTKNEIVDTTDFVVDELPEI